MDGAHLFLLTASLRRASFTEAMSEKAEVDDPSTMRGA
jgi:hypothetical protein